MPRKRKQPKIPLGRPVMGDQAKKRYTIMLQPSIADKLRDIGGDNLSGGIERAAVEWKGTSKK